MTGFGAGGLGRDAPAARRVTCGEAVETLRFLNRSKAETRRELSGAMESASCLDRTSASALKTPLASGLAPFFEGEDLALAGFLTAAFFGFSSASSFLAAVFLVVFFSIFRCS